MDIVWLGHSSFRIKGKDASLVTDPFSPDMVGLKFPKVEADIVTISHDHKDHNNLKGVEGNPKVVDGPGEYEIKEISIFGIHSYHDNQNGKERGANTIYAITIDGIKLCHLGDLGHKLSSEQISEIGTIDILFIPVGDVYTIGPAKAVEIVSAIEPKVVIPMHYKVPGLNPATFSELSGIDDFIKETGVEPLRLDKYTVSLDKLPEERQVVVLERRA
ncbi:MAG: MBL fold metallo-hydrolase [Candidatus Blackburnbacteria bacterium]|nr:MBL fold metallo-hydrolase [Candidatus Blackburnbacteria bacterium]